MVPETVWIPAVVSIAVTTIGQFTTFLVTRKNNSTQTKIKRMELSYNNAERLSTQIDKMSIELERERSTNRELRILNVSYEQKIDELRSNMVRLETENITLRQENFQQKVDLEEIRTEIVQLRQVVETASTTENSGPS